MDIESYSQLSIEDVLRRTQTDVTPDPGVGLEIAEYAYERAKTPVELGIAARQAGFRAEQAGKPESVVEQWFYKSRTALDSNDPTIKRELIATNLLEGRSLALRTEWLGTDSIASVAFASSAFARAEKILKEQHKFGGSWDRYGTMLARHRATHEAMNGDANFAASVASRGLWRAVRAKKEGASQEHGKFVVKQLSMNAAAFVLAVSKPLSKVPKIDDIRHRFAVKLLG